MSLPESTELLGVFVKACEAGKHAVGRYACFLTDRTGGRCLAGEAQTRQWCCRLRAFVDFLDEEKLVVTSNAQSPVKELGLFLPLVATMARWRIVKPHARASARAHVRAVTLDVLLRLRAARLAGVDFGILPGGRQPEVPAWAEPARRGEPIRGLRAAMRGGRPTQKQMTKALGFVPRAITRWFKKNERPSREALHALATYFARNGVGDGAISEDNVYRGLFWHCALADVCERLRQWLTAEEVVDLATVAASLARCEPPEPAGVDPALLLAGQFMAVGEEWVRHAQAHGAGEDWVRDIAQVQDDFVRAGIMLKQMESPSAQLDLALSEMPISSRAKAAHCARLSRALTRR